MTVVRTHGFCYFWLLTGPIAMCSMKAISDGCNIVGDGENPSSCRLWHVDQ